eukprot:m.364995 g.364995  ORF g.364995 m.364995 type:complete len:314 (+) comp20809_c0_seq7:123-1064(+)
MSLVAYSASDSDSEEGDDTHSSKVRKRKRISSNYSECFRSDCASAKEDDSAPTRSFAHVRGNWPTHVSIELEMDDDFPEVLNLLSKELQHIDPQISGVSQAKKLHVSISRTVVLRLHLIDNVVSKLREALQSVSRFKMQTTSLQHYVNENVTRGFLALRCFSTTGALSRIVDRIDMVFKSFGLPKYYEQRSFHASLLSWGIPLPQFEECHTPSTSASTGNSSRLHRESQGRPQASCNASSAVSAQEGVLALVARPAAHGTPGSAGCLPDATVRSLDEKYQGWRDDAALETQYCVTAVTCHVGHKVFTIPLHGG